MTSSKVPQFLSGIDTTSSITRPAASESQRIRACYRTIRLVDGEEVWTPIEKMMKRSRTPPTSLRLKPRAKKRQVRDDDGENADEEDGDDEQSEAEFDEHADQLKGDRSGLSALMNTKLVDLRLDNRSETASGPARIHELLVEQKLQGAANSGEMEWPSQGLEMQWRMDLAKATCWTPWTRRRRGLRLESLVQDATKCTCTIGAGNPNGTNGSPNLRSDRPTAL